MASWLGLAWLGSAYIAGRADREHVRACVSCYRCVFRSHKRRTEKKNKEVKKEAEKQKTRTQRKRPAANP